MGKSRKEVTGKERVRGLGSTALFQSWPSLNTVSDIWKTFSILDVGFPIRKMEIHLFCKVVEQWGYYENIGAFINRSFY